MNVKLREIMNMADDLSKMWMNLSLTEEESVELDTPDEELKEVVTREQSCVLGKLIADRMVSKEMIKTALMHWWKLLGILSFQVLGKICSWWNSLTRGINRGFWKESLWCLKGASFSLRTLMV